MLMIDVVYGNVPLVYIPKCSMNIHLVRTQIAAVSPEAV